MRIIYLENNQSLYLRFKNSYMKHIFNLMKNVKLKLLAAD